MTRKLITYISLFSILIIPASAQEIVTGLQKNLLVSDRKESRKDSKALAADTLELPFFDDFSVTDIFPDNRKWSDRFAFINNTYTDNQITIGVATLDALDDEGNLYESALGEIFQADHLTSNPINLNYAASENIWLSFFYEAGGLADPPEKNDTLILQFYAPEELRWYSVWKAEGDTIKGFTRVMININQPRFLKSGFRFRFINHVSLPGLPQERYSEVGNSDQWNIDYIYLDRNRSISDTTVADVAFRKPVRSVLKTHEAMPWKQFRQVYLQEMGSGISIYYRNNDIITRNVTRNFTVRDVFRNLQVHSFSAGATNIAPQSDVDYEAALIYTFDSPGEDSARFLITCYLITDDFDPKQNDTVKYYQDFGNYFAFDDGTSEAGYGINGLGSRNAMVALKFRSFVRDTVRAVKICFNDSYMNSNRRAFDLMIWSDNGGIPGDMIYSAEGLMVEPGDGNNGFYTYILPDGVETEGIFYVGWKQRSETFLNAGLDINTPHNGRQFYWLNGEWNQSQVAGSLMIRPVVGDPIKTTSVDDIPDPRQMPSFKIYPNPASDVISIELPGGEPHHPVYVSFFDMFGRQVKTVPYDSIIDISFLTKGIYSVVVVEKGRKTGFARLVKVR